jgi:7-keto-8-aminopelargonate synthetase-like enzyme
MPLMQSPPGAVTWIDGQSYRYFVGTGYLGLQGHPEVIRAAAEAVEKYGIGSANSRTAFGTTPPLLAVERAAAAMFGLDDAFYFASGWMGNNILVSSLGDRSQLIAVDECAHYSVIEAARLSGSTPIRFRHRDGDDLRTKLKEHLKPGQSPFVLSDGVFSATGAIAPAAKYCEVLADFPGAELCLDDAHGLAVLGKNGRGTFEHCGLWGHGVNAVQENPPSPALLFSGTMSKAFGGFGGIVPGEREFISRLKSHSPYMGGASAPPAMIAAATAKAIQLVVADPGLRRRLQSNVGLLKTGLRRMGFDVDDTPAPIVCLTVGSAANMQRIQAALMAKGIAIAYMAAYAGLAAEGGLRLAVFATHTEVMIQELLDELRRLV